MGKAGLNLSWYHKKYRPGRWTSYIFMNRSIAVFILMLSLLHAFFMRINRGSLQMYSCNINYTRKKKAEVPKVDYSSKAKSFNVRDFLITKCTVYHTYWSKFLKKIVREIFRVTALVTVLI
jgi:hypothetical protein